MGAAQNQGTVVDLDLQHPYLRNCKTRTAATETDMLATIPAQLPTYKKWKEQLDNLSASLPKSHHLLLAKGHHFDQGGVCSTSGELHLEYEYYPRLLSSEIALRKKQNRRFTEGELWYLLYVLVMSKDTLAQNGELIGDVHPRNVFLNNTGEAMVACLRSWPGQVSNYRRAVLEEECGYLAPEDFERLRLGAMDNQINTESQIFSIGLTLLSTASLQLQHQIYNMKEREFEEETFYSRLGKFQHDSLYSEIFRAVISNLLEVEPIKRMNLHELKAFLEKHTENIIAKKPLRIDNVGKKLQITINIMLKAIRPAITTEKPPIQSPNIPIANAVKPGVRVSGERIMNYINFEEKRPSQESIPPQLPKSQTSLEANQQRSSIFNVPPILPPPPNSNIYTKPPIPVSYLVTMINSNEQPHRPTINKTFSSTLIGPIINKTQSSKIESPPKYKPFETITTKGEIQKASPLKQQEAKLLKQEPSIEAEIQDQQSFKIPEQSKQGEKPIITQIWLGQQTSIGQLNLLMDTKIQGFGNSLINPKYEPQNVEQPPLESLHASHQSKNTHQQMVEQVKEESEQSPLQESGLAESKHSEKQQTPISHSLMKQSEQHQNQDYSNNNCSQNVEDQLLLDNIAKASEVKNDDQKQLSKIQVQQKGNVQLRHSQSKNSETSKKSNKIQVVQLQINNETKPFSPVVKVWGMNMGFNRNKKEQNSSQGAINVRQVEVDSQKTNENPLIPQINKKPIQKLKQQRCFQESQVVKRSSQIANVSLANRQENIKKDQYINNGSSIKNVAQNNDYILIQEQSKHNEHERSLQIQSLSIQKQKIKQKESQIIQYHTYADIATNGTFEECWQEILVFLRDPTDYTNQLDPNKVKIRILDDRWSLKIGPGVFDILLNKEQGKFLLKNCEGSRCEGDMLGGVYKDQQKKHRIWFNSAYYYNGAKIPSRLIIEECLKKCKDNIANSKK